MLGFAQAGQVRVDGGDDRALVAEVDLDLAQVLALFEHVRGVGMAQGVDMSFFFDAAGFEGQTEGALKGGATTRYARIANRQCSMRDEFGYRLSGIGHSPKARRRPQE